MKLLENTSDIKKALGPALDVIEHYSDYSGERYKVSRIRSELAEKYPTYCASCGHYFEDDCSDANTAYILGLEEGGTATEDNLVLLCNVCYELYSGGKASISEMYQTAWNWRKDLFISLRPEMEKRARLNVMPICRPLKTELFSRVYEAFQCQYFGKALRELGKIRKKGISPGDMAMSVIIEAQIERKRSARGSLERAYQLLSELDSDQVPIERLSLYYYELGYVCQMLGLHDESSVSYRKSVDAAHAVKDEYSEWEAFAARHRLYAVETIRTPFGKIPKNVLKKRSDEFDCLLEEAGKFKQPYAGRWQYNILGWKWRYFLKCADYDETLSVYHQWNEIRYRQNSTTGYRPDITSQLCGYDAMMLLGGQPNGDELFRILRSVSRSVAALLDFHVRPRNIRDLLYTFECALSFAMCQTSSNHGHVIQHIKTIRESILDGSSFLDPYRAG